MMRISQVNSTVWSNGIHGMAMAHHQILAYRCRRSSGVADRQMKKWASRLKDNIVALYLASRDARTPWYAKWLIVAIVAYAVSPLDLIPDFVPILGYLDDLLLLPLAVVLAIRLIPPEVLAECRASAQTQSLNTHSGRVAAIVVVVVWLLIFDGACIWAYRRIQG